MSMDSSVSISEEKIQRCISDSLKLIDGEFKKYCTTVQQGLDHITLLVAHITALKNTALTNIEDTALFKSDPETPLKLQYAIKKERYLEEAAVANILRSLHNNFSSIITQIDRIFNVYNSCNFQIQNIAKSSETSSCILEMIDTLDTFKRFFTKNHMGRKFIIELCSYADNIENVVELWDISEVSSLYEDLRTILITE